MLRARRLLARIGLAVVFVTFAFTMGCAHPRPALRFVHGSPRSPALDVYVSGQTAPLFSNVHYGEVTVYRSVTAGIHRIEIRPSGAPYTSIPVLVTEDRRYNIAKGYTGVAVGLLETSDPEARLRVLNYEEDFGAGASGRARVRFVHGSPDTPPVDIRLVPGDVKEVNDLKRFVASGAGGELVPSDRTLTFNYLTAESHRTMVTFNTAPLPTRTNWFAILTGLANEPAGSPDALVLLMVGPTGTAVGVTPPVTTAVIVPVITVAPPPPVQAVAYLLNGSADAPALDVYMSNILVASNLAFGNLAGPIQLPAGVRAFDLFVHTDVLGRPAGSPLATLRTTDLVPGQQYLAVVAGNLTPRGGQQSIQLVVYPASFSPGQSPLLRLVNTLAGALPLQAGVVQNGSFLTPLSIGAVAFAGSSQAAGTAFPAGPMQLGLAPVGAVSPVATFVVNDVPGMQAFAVPIGALSPASGERAVRLAVVNVNASPWTVVVLEPQ